MDFALDSVEYVTVSDSQRAEALAVLVSRERDWERTGTIVTALRQCDISTATLSLQSEKHICLRLRGPKSCLARRLWSGHLVSSRMNTKRSAISFKCF